jgi:hypothetical protein
MATSWMRSPSYQSVSTGWEGKTRVWLGVDRRGCCKSWLDVRKVARDGFSVLAERRVLIAGDSKTSLGGRTAEQLWGLMSPARTGLKHL